MNIVLKSCTGSRIACSPSICACLPPRTSANQLNNPSTEALKDQKNQKILGNCNNFETVHELLDLKLVILHFHKTYCIQHSELSIALLYDSFLPINYEHKLELQLCANVLSSEFVWNLHEMSNHNRNGSLMSHKYFLY